MIDIMKTSINLKDYKSNIKNVNCLIIGDIILDKYISGNVSRISQEAPVPILNVENKKYILGGAANVACNVKGFNLNTYLCGVVGKDDNGDKVVKLLEDKYIHYIGLQIHNRCTTIKTRVMGINQQLVRIDEEEDDDVTKEEESILLDIIKSMLNQVQIIILSDYSKGVCTETLCKKTISLCNERNIPVIVDPKAQEWEKYSNATLITPNLKEIACAYKKIVLNNTEHIREASTFLKQKYSIKNILVTRSQNGMSLLNERLQMTIYSAIAYEVYDVSGAGDTVVATIASILSAGYPLETAVKISNYAAGISVSRLGTTIVTIDEVINYINSINRITLNDKIVLQEEGVEIIHQWNENNQKVVFTNGCFDILHCGHVKYLDEAKNLGDKLVVGLNTDSSIKRIKGQSRPVNNENDRAMMLSALQSVDMVILFNEDTPYELIQKIKPDVLVKGSDYKENEVIGKEFAHKYKLVDYVDGYSTTNIIKRIKVLN